MPTSTITTTTAVLAFLSLASNTFAMPSIFQRALPGTRPQTTIAVANLTALSCTPQLLDSTTQEFGPLNSTTCRASLANFTNTYNESSSSSSTSSTSSSSSSNNKIPTNNPILTLTASPEHAKEHNKTDVLVPVEVFLPFESQLPGGPCGIVFAVYYGSNRNLPDVNVTLAELDAAANKVINACTGGTEGGNPGNGGNVVLTSKIDGSIIDVSVIRNV